MIWKQQCNAAMKLTIAQTINPPDWMRDTRTQKVMAALGGDAGKSLFVGGCVRNMLMNVPVADIDIATQFTPDEVMEKLKAAGIKAIPTGIDHGTVTAVTGGKSFEITTLRIDFKTDGRHAKVGYTDDWVEDAKRRDFTMNTLLADISGNIYDPLGIGIRDLNKRYVSFVGMPAERIAEDYLRILRFFRFHAFYGQGEMEAGALRACREASDKISSLSRERITAEFLKILSVPHCADILEIMFNYKVLAHLADKNYQPNMLRRLCELQHSLLPSSRDLIAGSVVIDKQDTVVKPRYDDIGGGALMPRLFVLGGNRSRFYDDILRLTHDQKKFLVKLEMAFCPAFYADARALKKAIFYHGNDLLLQGYLLLVAAEKVKLEPVLLDLLQNWQALQCPITGADLIAEGYVTGPDLGQELARRQEEWLEGEI